MNAKLMEKGNQGVEMYPDIRWDRWGESGR